MKVRRLIPDAQFPVAPQFVTEIKFAAELAIAIFAFECVLVVFVEWRVVRERTWRDEEVAADVQWHVVLGTDAVLRSENNVVAQFPAEAAHVVKRNPSANRKHRIQIVRTIEQQ